MSSKRVIKLAIQLPVPPVPPVTAYLTPAMEAFEALREYYTVRGEPIPQCDLKWYQWELENEKKEMEQFWEEHCETWAVMNAVLSGGDLMDVAIAQGIAREKMKGRPDKSELGPMPEYGTSMFWAWCRKRKEQRLQAEAAIIAAGGTVPPEKPKKPRAPKGSKAKKELVDITAGMGSMTI